MLGQAVLKAQPQEFAGFPRRLRGKAGHHGRQRRTPGRAAAGNVGSRNRPQARGLEQIAGVLEQNILHVVYKKNCV